MVHQLKLGTFGKIINGIRKEDIMNKREEKQMQSEVTRFRKELKDIGVKDETIELVLKDIYEYQTEQALKQIAEMQKRMIEMLEDKYE